MKLINPFGPKIAVLKIPKKPYEKPSLAFIAISCPLAISNPLSEKKSKPLLMSNLAVNKIERELIKIEIFIN